MVAFAILTGLFSYIILLLGLIASLTNGKIIVAVVIYVGTLWVIFSKKIKVEKIKIDFQKIRKDRLSVFLLGLLISLALVNLIGTLGPEISFDALWYHLTLPKIYLANHTITHIPGGLLYYSELPKLTEMLYTAALSLNGEILAKLIHYSFGVLTLIVLFKLSKKYLALNYSLLVLLLFYGTLVVSWESTSAYIDLSRTFFELLSLSLFLKWWENKKSRDLITSGIIMGLAMSTKHLAVGSVAVYAFLILIQSIKNNKLIDGFQNCFKFALAALVVVSPWYIISYLNTGNPLFPMFSNIFGSSLSIVIPTFPAIFVDGWNLILKPDDPISPIFLIFLPIVILFVWKSKKNLLLSLICFLYYIIWFITPRTGGGRFMLPYLPLISLLFVKVITESKNTLITNSFIVFLIAISFFHMGVRIIANAKFIPTLIGRETKLAFLTKTLPFDMGTFLDTDEYFEKNIKKEDKVLIIGSHNLFYVNFPFIHETWVKEGDYYNYVLTQNAPLPVKFEKYPQIYENPITGVRLYRVI